MATILPEIKYLVHPTAQAPLTPEMIKAINCIDPTSPMGIALRNEKRDTEGRVKRVNFSNPKDHRGSDVLNMPHMNLYYDNQQCHLYLKAPDSKDLTNPNNVRINVKGANSASDLPLPRQGDVVPGTYTMMRGPRELRELDLYPGVVSQNSAAATTAPPPMPIPTEADFPPLSRATPPSGSRVSGGRGAPVAPSTSAGQGRPGSSTAGTSATGAQGIVQPKLPNPSTLPKSSGARSSQTGA